jgi:ABC-type transporter Mla MlaB component
MLARSAEEIPDGEGWRYEPKWDGFRCLVERGDGGAGEVEIASRDARPLGRYFPELVELLVAAPAEPEKPTHTDPVGFEAETLKWSGVMTGAVAPPLGKLADSMHSCAVVAVDMSDVERIDFVCAGALLNLINRIESQRKAVQIVGASPIIRALHISAATPWPRVRRMVAVIPVSSATIFPGL